ncbi:MAG: type II/IV secretion system protein [Planctomycetes bacterium]|jgi:type IV pilus assembly protein PilB|nr:type II/IV secretion system protein [Planctomycetota bacterium]
MIANDSNRKLQLGQLLIQHGAVTDDQLKSALEYQKQKGATMLLGEVLQKLDICSEEQIMSALAAGYGIPFAHISPRIADPKVIDVLPREFLDKHCVLPLFKIRNRLTLAVNEPANVFLIEEIGRLTDCEILIVCATTKEIKATLENHLPSANIFVIDDIFDDGDAGELSLVETKVEDIGDLELAAEGSPVIKLVNYLIFHAVREGASDIHIEPDENSLRVRYRVDGMLYEKIRPPVKMLPAISSRIKIMAGLDISERRLPQDGGIHVMMDSRPIDLRVSTLAGRHGEKIVIRIIDNRSVLVNLEKLGFSYEMLKEWRGVLEAPNGIVLVTGPTGSGKSTTLYSVLKELNNDAVNICTVEDPVEFNLGGINQFQVNDRIGFSFASALRSLLRQDPDIIMVGEIRDQETARIAVQAALTGHLVFSTLHTNDASGAVTRLVNVGVEPYLVAASLNAVLAQRLVRKICTACKEPYEVSPSVRRAVERLAGDVQTFYHGVGCPKCRGSGFSGRIGIYELLVPNDGMRDKICASPTLNELHAAAVSSGMVTLRQDGMSKVKAGITTIEEVLRATAA